MLSDDPFVRQLEEEQETPRIQSCRWVWCRESFSSRPALNDHIISVHVDHKSVKRSDIPTLRQLEAASSKSFDIIPKTLKPNLASLPSSPTSSPLSHPSALQSSPIQGQPSVSYNDQSNSQMVDKHSTPVARSLPFTPLKNVFGPSFASLSSPADSHMYSPIIPESPELSKMISDNPVNGKGRSIGYGDNSPSGSSSSSSRDSVEKQLTQSMEDCPPHPDNNSTENTGLTKEAVQSQLHTHSVTITRFQSATHSSVRLRRQTWYQGVPKSHSRPSKPSRAKCMAATVNHSTKSRAGDSSGSGVSSTPEWPQIRQQEAHTHTNFPYQTQPSYDSQPMI